MDEWPKKGDQLPAGGTLRTRYAQDADWQIWTTDEGSALLVANALHEAWLDQGLLEPGVFLPLGTGSLCAEVRLPEFVSSAQDGPAPQSATQAFALASCLAHTRRAMPDAHLSHALYLPLIPHLLPTAEGPDPERDPQTLGRWLTGGMDVPFTDRKRMIEWVPGMTEDTYNTLLGLLGWQETTPQRVRAIEPRQIEVSAVATRRTTPHREGPFSLPGREQIERVFRERIIDVIDREDAYRRMGIGFPGPTLLVGPPGCGKTFAVEQLVEYLGWPSFEVSAGTIGSSYIHETSRLISQLFEQATENAPSIVVMDELEAFLSERASLGGGHQHRMEETAEFLRYLPELPKRRVLLFGMTNLPDLVDKAIMRKGRFDHVIEVGMPTQDEVTAILDSLLRDVPREGGLDLAPVAHRLVGRPVSDVAYVAKEAGRLAVTQGRDRIGSAQLHAACDDLMGGDTRRRRRIGFV